MRAGDLRDSITIEARTSTPDGLGQPVPSWAPVVTVRAAIEPLGGRELVAAQALASEVQLKIRLRRRNDIDPSMRIQHQGRHYGIVAVLPVSPSETHLLCRLGAADH